MLKKLLIRNLILLIPFQFAGAQIGTDIVDWESFLSQHDMVWDTIPPDYYGGAISGNGLLGTNVYADTLPATYRFDIGRSDVTEMRTGGETLYNGARLPIGYFTLTTSTPALSEEMRVHLHTATTTGKITTKQGTISFESFVDANENMIVIETTATGNETDYEWQWNPGKAISPRTSFSYTHQSTPPEYLAHANPEPEISQKGGYKLCVQNLYSGYTYVTAWKEERQAGRRLFYITVSFEKGTSAAISSALATLDSYQSRSLKERKQKHDEWWANYYPASFAHFADKKIESFYWIQQYKFACLTRSGKNIIDLMGPWTTRTPWPAIWLNLNIQLTYSPLFTANRLELTEPVWESLHKNIESLSRNVPVKEWQQDAIAIGRSSSYDLVSPLRMDLAEQKPIRSRQPDLVIILLLPILHV